MQLFDDEFADSFPFDILDATKLIPEETIPIKPVGRLVLDRCVDNFFAETEQVAFCTQNVIPGVDFTNDPLLQGRNFSYLDTQTKRLGGPNFTHIPVNAPKCPMANFQRDGHMTTTVPTGRANYEPNSWPTDQSGPRESTAGYEHFQAAEGGEMRKIRAERFADHFSQARQFFESQAPVEREHIVQALVFELSKVKTSEIRQRVVAQLLNIDEGLANGVASGLGLADMPQAAVAARETLEGLPQCPSLSIVRNGPETFEGRTVGVLLSDGFPMKTLKALHACVEQEKANLKIVAPRIGGVTCDQGMLHPAHETVDGGPSVLFDAIAVILSEEGASSLSMNRAAQDFVGDAFAHCKYIAHTAEASALMQAANVKPGVDEAVVQISGQSDVDGFVQACRNLRYWPREEMAESFGQA